MEGVLVKGKRTKRQRHHLSSPAGSSAPSPSSSAEFSDAATEEDEDLVNCLMLLARGGHPPKSNTITAVQFPIQQSSEPATNSTAKAGSSIHECETCHKFFKSHQALGGHRASHKKQKLLIPPVSANRSKMAVMDEAAIQLSMNSFSSAAVVKGRIHQCSQCRAEFSSGQALGGHMRRHRQPGLPEMNREEEKHNGLALDLNLPPPPFNDDDGDGEKVFSSSSPASARKPAPSLSFASKTPILLISSSLVGCHY